MPNSEQAYWFALKVFYRKDLQVRDDFRKAGHDSYLTSLVSGLLFVHCTEDELQQYKKTHDTALLYYTDPASDAHGKPGRIPDREMDNFRIATSLASTDPDAIYLGSDTEKLCRETASA